MAPCAYYAFQMHHDFSPLSNHLNGDVHVLKSERQLDSSQLLSVNYLKGSRSVVTTWLWIVISAVAWSLHLSVDPTCNKAGLHNQVSLILASCVQTSSSCPHKRPQTFSCRSHSWLSRLKESNRAAWMWFLFNIMLHEAKIKSQLCLVFGMRKPQTETITIKPMIIVMAELGS